MSRSAGSRTPRAGARLRLACAAILAMLPPSATALDLQQLMTEMPGDHPAFAWLNYPRQPPRPKAKEAKEGKDAKEAKDLKNGREAK